MSTLRSSRRGFLKALGAGALALPFYRLLEGRKAQAGAAGKRVLFFYFPDGVAVPNPYGDLAQNFHASGSESSFTLSTQLEPLAEYQDECVFLNGLGMWGDDVGNHPAGSKKLLTGRNDGRGQSIDQYLAGSIGAQAPYKHLCLGAMANRDNASGDKHISHPTGDGNTLPPQDNPRIAFESLFGAGSGAGPGGAVDPVEVSVIDGVLDDMNTLRAQLGAVEAVKLDQHLASLREVEKRIKGDFSVPSASCESPFVDMSTFTDADCAPSPGTPGYTDARFPDVLRAQTDLMVLAMACDLTRVGVLQASHHTANELNMGLFPGTDMAALHPNGMRSHEASHYGSTNDGKFAAYVAQRRWFVKQFAYLLGKLRDTEEPGGGGSMLDHSLVVLCSEVGDGNTHSHSDVPFVLAGKAGGAIQTGRLLKYDNRPHSDLLVSIAHAMGDPVGSFGEWSSGPLPGLLS